MDQDAVVQERAKIIERYGVWTDHNIQLAGELYTMDPSVRSEKLRRIVQIVSDLAKRPISELRILDLACLEGQYAVEFARQGAQVVAIEGREANIEKARFSKRALGLDNLELIHGDVRDLSRERHGSFDIVLCLGILYHLDAPDVFAFLERIGEVCTEFAVFDTYVSLAPKRSYQYGGKEYWGRDIPEHSAEQTRSDKLTKLWASIDNNKSVWLTKRTLINLLMRFRFTSVYECYVPLELGKPSDRVTLVAIKGRQPEILTNPVRAEEAPTECPETLVTPPSDLQRPFADLTRNFVSLFPPSLRRGTKKVLRSVGIMRKPPALWERKSGFRW